jgi:hypothetical protein
MIKHLLILRPETIRRKHKRIQDTGEIRSQKHGKKAKITRRNYVKLRSSCKAK